MRNELSSNSETTLIRDNGVAHISKPEGEYYVIYGQHNITQSSDILPLAIDGLVLESGLYNWNTEFPQYTLDEMMASTQYKNIAPEAIERGVPVYLADPYISSLEQIPAVEGAVAYGAELGMGTLLLSSAIKEARQKKESLSRRDLLRIGLKGLAGLWLLTPSITSISELLLGQNPYTVGFEEEVVKTNARIHPEYNLISVTLRNVIIAHKLQYLMESLGTHPSIATLIGLAHAGIEDSIRISPDERLKFLQHFKSVIQQIANNPTLYTIEGFIPKGTQMGMQSKMEVPELKALLST